jgi:hypothetical protein
MTIPARFPFAYKATFATARDFFSDRMLVGTIDVDVPVMTSAECPVAVSWRTDRDQRTPAARFGESQGKSKYVRHRDGRVYSPLSLRGEGPGLSVESLPRQDRSDFINDPEGEIAFLFNRPLPGWEDRFKTLKGWLGGKYKRQPKEDDVMMRMNSDYAIRKAEAEAIAPRLAVVDGVVYTQVHEPKLSVSTYYFHRRGDMPEGVSQCPLVSVFLGEARFGAKWPPHSNSQGLDAKAESLVISITELDDLLRSFKDRGLPVLLDFDDLALSDRVEFEFNGEANRRWRVVGEVVSRFADQVLRMPESVFQSWARLRSISMLPETDVTVETLEGAYDDYIRLCSTMDPKDRDRARLMEAAEWWNEAQISLGASLVMSHRP